MATKKKAPVVVDETPVTAPLFVKHHYLILESADGHEFYVDRNAATNSRIIAAALKELANRADEDTEDPADSSLGGGGNGSGSNTVQYDPSQQQQSAAPQPSYTIMGGDIEVKANGEKAANASSQLPIVYPHTLMAATMTQQRPGTGDQNQATVGRSGGLGSSGAQSMGTSPAAGAKGAAANKANQQLLAQQELLNQQLTQYQQVDAALAMMQELPLTHLRLVHIKEELLELAIKYMYYKARNDMVSEAEQRQGFHALVSTRSHPPAPLASAGSFAAFGSTSAGAASGPVSPSKQRKSVAAGAQTGGGSPTVDPITGGGLIFVPPTFSQKHIELLAVSALLQL